MLTQCPECALQVSDKALSCPHCGFPMLEQNKSLVKRAHKKKRLPNGFGQITKLKDQNLRNPFRAIVTVGFTEYGKPIQKLLKPVAYFRTYNDAYEALVEYHKKPYEEKSTITLRELFDKWINDYYDPQNKSSQYKHSLSLFKKCRAIENLKVTDIKPLMLKNFIESIDSSADLKSRLKYLFNLLFDYAVSLEIVEKNVSRNFELSTNIKNTRKSETESHVPFTDAELKVLWDNKDNKYVATILIMCYSGWRPGELRNLNINLQELTITGGSKTASGLNRVVPIHSCIENMVKEKALTGFETYKYLLKNFRTLTDGLLGTVHTPHDCRTTFITNCKKYEVDEYAIKYMVGHHISDITERVYTRRTIDWLRTEIEKIKADV